MANETRIRANFIGGVVDDNPLAIGATTLTSSSLTGLPPIGATEHAVIVLDPAGVGGTPEIVHVTAHTAGATTATIIRAMEDTIARQHNLNTTWMHTATVRDFVQSYVATQTGTVVDNPTPTADTVVSGMTINIPAYSSPRTYLVTAFAKFSASHPNGFTPYLDATPIISGTRIGSTTAEGSAHHVSISGAIVVVPGDSAPHTITLQYNAISSTAATTFSWRTITATLVG
jgi:hypothetical protein